MAYNLFIKNLKIYYYSGRNGKMKRFKLLSLTLAFALVLTTMFAGAESVFADTAQADSDKAVIGSSLENAKMMRAADTSTPSETIAAVNLNTATPK